MGVKVYSLEHSLAAILDASRGGFLTGAQGALNPQRPVAQA